MTNTLQLFNLSSKSSTFDSTGLFGPHETLMSFIRNHFPFFSLYRSIKITINDVPQASIVTNILDSGGVCVWWGPGVPWGLCFLLNFVALKNKV